MYYRVKAYAGHIGAGKSVLLTFAIEANSMTEAIAVARKMPMVKHTHPTAIKDVVEITEKEFNKLRQQSAYERGNMK